MCAQNPNNFRGTALSAAGLIYNIDFARESKTYYPGEIVTGKILFSTSTRDPLQGNNRKSMCHDWYSVVMM